MWSFRIETLWPDCLRSNPGPSTSQLWDIRQIPWISVHLSFLMRKWKWKYQSNWVLWGANDLPFVKHWEFCLVHTGARSILWGAGSWLKICVCIFRPDLYNDKHFPQQASQGKSALLSLNWVHSQNTDISWKDLRSGTQAPLAGLDLAHKLHS